MDKEQERFIQKSEEIEINVIPQCSSCKYNINRDSCEKYKDKPYEYLKNIETCPKKEKNI